MPKKGPWEESGLRQVQSFSVFCGHGATFLGAQVAHTCSDITPAWSGSRGHGQPRLASVHREVLGGRSTVSCRLWCPSSDGSIFSSRVPSRGQGRPRLRWGQPPAGPRWRSPERKRASVHRAAGTQLFGWPHSPPPLSSNWWTPCIPRGAPVLSSQKRTSLSCPQTHSPAIVKGICLGRRRLESAGAGS